MSTRNGKIARLPRFIRDQLNTRLEDSEESPELLDWLNGLPEVQEVLREHFNGVPISKQNLSQWRMGGFQEALARRDLAQDVVDFSDLASEADESCPVAELADQAAVLLAARLGALLANWDGEPDEKFRAKVKILNAIGRTVVQAQRQIHRSRRELFEMQTAHEQKEKEEKKETAKKLAGRWFDAVQTPGLAKLFGGGTGGRKIATYILAVQRGDLEAELNLEPTDTFEDDPTNPIRAVRRDSAPVTPSQSGSK